jgi:hypothetical protein
VITGKCIQFPPRYPLFLFDARTSAENFSVALLCHRPKHPLNRQHRLSPPLTTAIDCFLVASTFEHSTFRQANCFFLGSIHLSPGQKAHVDELLLESDSVNEFFREHCVADTTAEGLTVTDAFAAYTDYCMERGWAGLNRTQFGHDCQEIAQRLFHVAIRHDIKGVDGKKQRGWKGFRLLGSNEEKPC